MRKRYGRKHGLPAYVAATFLGYSRVEAGRYYWHDVFARVFIGIVSSYLLTKLFLTVPGVHDPLGKANMM